MMRRLALPLALAASCALVSGCAATRAAVQPQAATASEASPASTAPSSQVPTASPSATPAIVASTPPTPPARASRLAFGDSVMLGSKKLLEGRGFIVDAKVGRQFGASYNAIVKLRTANRLPTNIVIHLGTNGTISVRDCRAVVDAAGPDHRVFFVNVRVPRPWSHGNNVALGTCDSAYPVDRVIIINWAAAAGQHRDWFGPDNIHPDAVGRTAYTDLIASAVDHRGL